MTTTTTTKGTAKRRTTRAGTEAETGTPVRGGAATTVMEGRVLAALRELMLRRVQRSCGGFSVDDITCEMRTMADVSEVVEELERAGKIRFRGWDDVEEDGVSCYALSEAAAGEVVGVLPEGTRYGRHGLVALVAVGEVARRDDGSRMGQPGEHHAREMRLRALGAWLIQAQRYELALVMIRRMKRIQDLDNERWRRWDEGYVRGGAKGWNCRSLVVVGGSGGSLLSRDNKVTTEEGEGRAA